MLTDKILLKLTPELNKSIDDAFSKYLKETGAYISRSNFIRKILQSYCELQLSETNALVIAGILESQALYLKGKNEMGSYKILFELSEKFKKLWIGMKD